MTFPVTSDRVYRRTASETLNAGTFGRYVLYTDADASNNFALALPSASSLIEGASQRIICRGDRSIAITSASSDIIDPTDGSPNETPTNSVTVPAHGGMIEIIVNSSDQYLISAPLANLGTVALTGAYSDLTGTPTLATVATTGAYSDLTGKPTLGATDLDGLSDVNITGADTAEYLRYSGSAWVDTSLTIVTTSVLS